MPEKQPEVRNVVEKVEEEASAGTTRRDLFHIGGTA
jgi:hypothetical protein